MNISNQKAHFRIILVHLALWIAFLAIPTYLFSVLISLKVKEAQVMEVTRIVYTYCILIGLFYYNYYVLIPKFLFNNRYLLYSFYLFAIYILISTIPILIFSEIFEVEVFDTDLIPQLDEFDWLLLVMLYLVSFVVSLALRLNARLQHTENERISAQLSYLKTQINPHFLFNTLNGIYSTAMDKSPRAADMIEKLSSMMRYTIYETTADYVALNSEIEYIQNYIQLQKDRFDDSVNINFKCEGDFYENQIAPLLIIPFIENSFKHGVNSEQDSDIQILLSCKNDIFEMIVKNNKVFLDSSGDEASGIGIQNTRGRLDLIYPQKHTLEIQETVNTFTVKLKIELL